MPNNEGRKERPGYYAIIPADVRYDEGLPPNAKLMYGEITALSNSLGYCYASNRYFADLYGFTKKTISNLISCLEKRGYVHVEILRTADGVVDQRRIWVSKTVDLFPGGIPQKKDTYTSFPSQNPLNTRDLEPRGIPQKRDTPLVKKGEGIPQKFQQNNTSINNTPITPKGDARFDKFWSAYPRKIDKQRALKAFTKINPDDKLLQTMLVALSNQAKSSQWTKDNGSYIPHASTWLNGKRWEDEIANANSTSEITKQRGVEEWD